jgi:hypothetical protein
MIMSQKTQSPTSAPAALSGDWMKRIETALASGQAPAYDDLEQGVHSLLSQVAGLRSIAAEAEAAFHFINQECRLMQVHKGVLSICIDLDRKIFFGEGARAAIAAKIAVLEAAKQDETETVMEAEVI